MIPAGTPTANFTKMAEVDTDKTPIIIAIYGLNGGTLNIKTPLPGYINEHISYFIIISLK